jgi:hypothetical protein
VTGAVILVHAQRTHWQQQRAERCARGHLRLHGGNKHQRRHDDDAASDTKQSGENASAKTNQDEDEDSHLNS